MLIAAEAQVPNSNAQDLSKDIYRGQVVFTELPTSTDSRLPTNQANGCPSINAVERVCSPLLGSHVADLLQAAASVLEATTVLSNDFVRELLH